MKPPKGEEKDCCHGNSREAAFERIRVVFMFLFLQSLEAENDSFLFVMAVVVLEFPWEDS